MLPFTDRAAIFREQAQPSKGPNVRVKTQLYPNVPCLIVPVSSFDRMNAYGLESTHVVWVPRWLTLLKEDEVRVGRRTEPVTGTVTPIVYVVNGRRMFKVGLRHKAFYASERE